MREKILWILYTVQRARGCSIKPQLKDERKDGREAP